MQVEHWGSLPTDDDGVQLTPDKYVPTAAKKPKLDEIRLRGEIQPDEKQ